MPRYNAIVEGYETVQTDWWVTVEADNYEHARAILQTLCECDDFDRIGFVKDWGMEATGGKSNMQLVSHTDPEEDK